jgi:hypothetical protein
MLQMLFRLLIILPALAFLVLSLRLLSKMVKTDHHG